MPKIEHNHTSRGHDVITYSRTLVDPITSLVKKNTQKNNNKKNEKQNKNIDANITQEMQLNHTNGFELVQIYESIGK